MSSSDVLREARMSARRTYNAQMEVLEDEGFMAGVFEALREESSGSRGKTLDEIKREHGIQN